jgi:chemotaxis protein methyltransferase CheR
LHEDAGISLDKGKEYLVEARLTPIAIEAGLSNIAELIDKMKRDGLGALRRSVVEALTINETSFFRDLEPFNALRLEIFPELIKQRAASRELTIWSAAAATGQEAYSVSMLLLENFPQLRDWKITIIATDISRSVLEKAKTGVYSQFETNRGLPALYLIKYFDQVGTNWRVKPILKKMIRFEELNLTKPFSFVSYVDVVLIRNVLIYFDAETRENILSRVTQVMQSDGFLLLGTSESIGKIGKNTFQRSCGKCTYYQRKRESSVPQTLVSPLQNF